MGARLLTLSILALVACPVALSTSDSATFRQALLAHEIADPAVNEAASAGASPSESDVSDVLQQIVASANKASRRGFVKRNIGSVKAAPAAATGTSDGSGATAAAEQEHKSVYLRPHLVHPRDTTTGKSGATRHRPSEVQSEFYMSDSEGGSRYTALGESNPRALSWTRRVVDPSLLIQREVPFSVHGRGAWSRRPAPASSQLFEDEGVVRWVPQPNKYLLLFCAFGRMSNQMACLKKTFRMAVLLNRTLLLPPMNMLMFHGAVDEVWAPETAVDWGRLVRCLMPAYGPRTVMTFDEYFEKHGVDKIVLQKFHCAAPGKPDRCAHPLRIHAMKEMLRDTLELPAVEQWPKWLEPSRLASPYMVTDEQVKAALGGNQESVLCVGEMFGISFAKPTSQFALARPEHCANLWMPHKYLVNFAENVIARAIKTKFAALHLRRGDFYLESLMAKKKQKVSSPYYSYSPIVEVAKTVARRLREARIKALYIATDASNVELDMFKSVLTDTYPIGRVMTLKDVLDNEAWLQRQGWALGALRMAETSPTGVPWVLADKAIALRASLFLGTKASSFSTDIMEMRCEQAWKAGPDVTSLSCSARRCSPITC